MPDIFYLISRWWKQILVIMVLPIGTVSAIVYFLPEKYLSVTTALPTNPALADKTSVFNENIQIPSPNLGTEAELDIIVGTAQLDTVYFAVAKAFNLWDHYRTEEKGDHAVYKAMHLLRQNTNVSKSAYGELKVKVWDTDKNLAPQLGNDDRNCNDNRLRSLHSSGMHWTASHSLRSMRRSSPSSAIMSTTLPCSFVSYRSYSYTHKRLRPE